MAVVESMTFSNHLRELLKLIKVLQKALFIFSHVKADDSTGNLICVGFCKCELPFLGTVCKEGRGS